MIKLGLAPIELHFKDKRGFLKEGQRVRLTIRSGIELWQGNLRIQYRDGETYEGMVTFFDDGLVDLLTDSGELMRVYARDAAFDFEPIE
ncbi:MAG: hypothetical protein WCK70_12330 [Chloroflexales bacterium]|jgi:hypothetical protein